MKNILVIDDSALMRRVFRDIIDADGRFKVTDTAKDGIEGLAVLDRKRFDAIVLDINMPKMNGIEFLEELQIRKRKEKVIVVSTDTAEGAAVTIKALELGALDFIQKPKNTLDSKDAAFQNHFLNVLQAACETSLDSVVNTRIRNVSKDIKSNRKLEEELTTKKVDEGLLARVKAKTTNGNRKLVALCCSTGGPNALQHVIPLLPANLDAPVIMVQHMPKGFTKSLAERLDSLSSVTVKEAEENDIPQKGCVYIARGGSHMKFEDNAKGGRLFYSDEPAREGVKPAANYMYESLMGSGFDKIVCVVMTGMGQDGTVGIKNLITTNKLHIISQDEKSSTVYGMPKAIAQTGLVNQVVDLDLIAQEIIMSVGVR